MWVSRELTEEEYNELYPMVFKHVKSLDYRVIVALCTSLLLSRNAHNWREVISILQNQNRVQKPNIEG